MTLHPTRRRFSVTEYHRMTQAGILGEDDRVELIDGEVIEMTPIGRRHAACVARLTEVFSRTFAGEAIVWVQNPVYIAEFSEPQPDLALLRRQPDFYASGHPSAKDVLLLVEVCDTSIETDRRLKLPLYAGANIPEVWLVDPEQENITTYVDASSKGYRTVRIMRRGELVTLIAFSNRSVAATDILG